MPATPYFKSGEWNFICDLCGAKGKSGDARKTWAGHYVCSKHREERNPQDFVRAPRDPQPLPWTRAKDGS